MSDEPESPCFKPVIDVVIPVLVVTVVVVSGFDADTHCCRTVDVFIKFASELSAKPPPNAPEPPLASAPAFINGLPVNSGGVDTLNSSLPIVPLYFCPAPNSNLDVGSQSQCVSGGATC